MLLTLLAKQTVKAGAIVMQVLWLSSLEEYVLVWGFVLHILRENTHLKLPWLFSLTHSFAKCSWMADEVADGFGSLCLYTSMIQPEIIDCTEFPGSYKVKFVSSVKFTA